jgi:hypothetical protein
VTAYRDPVAPPPRAPPPTLVLRNLTFWLSISAIVLCAGFSVMGALFGYGVSVRCAREAPPSVVTCRVWEPVTWTTVEFRGGAGALTVTDPEMDEGHTLLVVPGFRSIPVDPARARAATAAYDRFVADPTPRAFTAWLPGSLLLGALFALAGLGGVVALGAHVSWHTIAIDAEGDLLVVERNRAFRRPTRTRRALSTIDSVSVEPVDDSDAYDIVLTIGERKEVVLRSSDGACSRAKAAIEAAAAVVKRRLREAGRQSS